MSYTICAIVTVYYPDELVVKNILTLKKQVPLVIIADNTPNKNNSELFGTHSGITYIANEKNLGLSLAFNTCLKLEQARLSDYIIFMDQDSLVSDNLVEVLIHDYNLLYTSGYKIGCIGPMIYDKNKHKTVNKGTQELQDGIFIKDKIYASSMLTTYKNLQLIGFWNEEIFLDLADWDVCWRFQKAGLLCCMSYNTVLKHDLSLSVPIREYYQIRDCLKLLFKVYTPLKARIRFLCMIFIRSIIHLVFIPKERLLRMKYILLGIHDFLRHKNGVIDVPTQK
jgi:rhamnosyltransferase